MDFLEKLGDTIVVTGKAAADKARDISEVAKLKGQIATWEEVIRKNYKEIGKIYYEQYGNMAEELFEKQCREIENAKVGIEALQEKLKELRGESV